MVEPRPVQTSAVYLVGRGAAPQFPAIPPPSPPSPVTPEPSTPCTPIEELNLDACNEDYRRRVPYHSVQSSDTSFPNDLGDTAPLDDRLAAAVHVLSTEAAALSSLTQLYASDPLAREAFSRAVEIITRPSPAHHPRGKLVLIGVGKSGHIARKLTATFNSFSVPATFLHPTEALHGDLGVINSRTDTALLITYSGKTPEITAVLPHLDPALPLVLLTGAAQHGKHCDVVRLRPDAIVLPSPVHELETASFGVAAPTTSTTAALAVGDALALVCAGELHGRSPSPASARSSRGVPRVASVFARNHPGGAIGAANNAPPSTSSSSSSLSSLAAPQRAPLTLRQLATPWEEIPTAAAEPDLAPPGPRLLANPPLTAADVLRAGYASPSGWVRVRCSGGGSDGRSPPPGGDDGVVSPTRIRGLRSRDLGRPVDEVPGLVVRRGAFLSVAADATATAAGAAEWVRELMKRGGSSGSNNNNGGDDRGGAGAGACRPDSVVCLLEEGKCVGVLEVKALLESLDS